MGIGIKLLTTEAELKHTIQLYCRFHWGVVFVCASVKTSECDRKDWKGADCGFCMGGFSPPPFYTLGSVNRAFVWKQNWVRPYRLRRLFSYLRFSSKVNHKLFVFKHSEGSQSSKLKNCLFCSIRERLKVNSIKGTWLPQAQACTVFPQTISYTLSSHLAGLPLSSMENQRLASSFTNRQWPAKMYRTATPIMHCTLLD